MISQHYKYKPKHIETQNMEENEFHLVSTFTQLMKSNLVLFQPSHNLLNVTLSSSSLQTT